LTVAASLPPPPRTPGPYAAACWAWKMASFT
jgi:hypothetical protein